MDGAYDEIKCQPSLFLPRGAERPASASCHPKMKPRRGCWMFALVPQERFGCRVTRPGLGSDPRTSRGHSPGQGPQCQPAPPPVACAPAPAKPPGLIFLKREGYVFHKGECGAGGCDYGTDKQAFAVAVGGGGRGEPGGQRGGRVHSETKNSAGNACAAGNAQLRGFRRSDLMLTVCTCRSAFSPKQKQKELFINLVLIYAISDYKVIKISEKNRKKRAYM